MNEYTQDWFSHNVPVWKAVVLPNLPAGRRRWLELGSYEGRSAEWTLRHALRDGDEMVCVDIWHTADVERRFDANVGDRVRKIKGYIVPTLLGLIHAGEKFDCIYIDGDHDGRATLESAVLSWMLLSVGGFLIFDDYRYTIPSHQSMGKIDTKPGIDAFLDCYCLRLQVLHRAAQVIVLKSA
jgi:predicted O-methyltransferase YrrM